MRTKMITKQILVSCLIVFLSLDLNAQWTQITSDFNKQLHTSSVLSENEAFVGGRELGLYKTTDGGNNWQVVCSGFICTDFNTSNFDPYWYYFEDLHFYSENEGIATLSVDENWIGEMVYMQPTHNHGYIVKTYDGGQNWSIVREAPLGVNFQDLIVLENDRVIAIGHNGVYLESLNKGETWTAINIGTDLHLRSLEFLGNNELIMIADNGIQPSSSPPTTLASFKSTDNGVTWSENTISLDIVFGFFGELEMFDNLNGVCHMTNFLNYAGDALLTTNDGGLSWSLGHFPVPDDLEDIMFINNLEGWAVGGDWCDDNGCYNSGVILKTVDGGATWNIEFQSATVNEIQSLNIFGEKVLAVSHGNYGNNGMIYISDYEVNNISTLEFGTIEFDYFVDKEGNVQINWNDNSEEKEFSIYIYDLTGKVLAETKKEKGNLTSSVNIPISTGNRILVLNVQNSETLASVKIFLR